MCAAATYALMIGSELYEQATPPSDHALLTALTEAAVCQSIVIVQCLSY